MQHHHHSHFSPLLFLTIFCGVVRIASSAEITIHNASELVEFSNNVNSGTNYSGTTVVLGSDIVFSEELSSKFKPIGQNKNIYFNSVFDGKGYTISNLMMKSGNGRVGLFGESHGPITIKNVVIDSSCSFSNSNYASGTYCMGSIIGLCNTINGPCTVESIVNMASVTLTGNKSGYSFVGGIIGQLYSTNDHESTIKNCINYGPITRLGCSGEKAMVGGIVGEYYGKYILNCINYGVITQSEASNDNISYIGGIAGKTWNVTIENCVSAGEIASNSTNNNIGAIVGSASVNRAINITHCYWSSGVGYSEAYGKSESVLEIVDSYQTEIDSSFVEELNKRMQGSQKWFLNPNNYTVTFIVNEEKVLFTTSQLVLTPNIAEVNGYTLDGWYNNSNCTDEFTSYEISGNITLYARYTNIYALTLDFDNGTVIEKEYQYNETVYLPKDVKREGYVFDKWNDTIETMPNHNVIVKALWNETSEYVEIVFGTKDMTKNEVKDIIKGFAGSDATFTIESFDVDNGAGETRVIIKFADRKEAENFVEVISESSENTKGLIKDIKFISDIKDFVARTYVSVLLLVFALNI